jgi:hypothetical protein
LLGTVALHHKAVQEDALKMKAADPLQHQELFTQQQNNNIPHKLNIGVLFSGPPDIPFLVAVDVTGTNSVTVRFQEPEHQDAAICTKFKGDFFLTTFY